MRSIRQAAKAEAKRAWNFIVRDSRFRISERYHAGGEVPSENGTYEGPTSVDWNGFGGLVTTDELLKYFVIDLSGPHVLGQSLAQTYAIRHNNEAIRRAFGVPDTLAEGYYPDDEPSRGDA